MKMWLSISSTNSKRLLSSKNWTDWRWYIDLVWLKDQYISFACWSRSACRSNYSSSNWNKAVKSQFHSCFRSLDIHQAFGTMIQFSQWSSKDLSNKVSKKQLRHQPSVSIYFLMIPKNCITIWSVEISYRFRIPSLWRLIMSWPNRMIFHVMYIWNLCIQKTFKEPNHDILVTRPDSANKSLTWDKRESACIYSKELTEISPNKLNILCARMNILSKSSSLQGKAESSLVDWLDLRQDYFQSARLQEEDHQNSYSSMLSMISLRTEHPHNHNHNHTHSKIINKFNTNPQSNSCNLWRSHFITCMSKQQMATII